MPKQRIQKILAAAGFGSRRACEDLVAYGRVTVNGQTVSSLPVLVDPAVDRITVDGRTVTTEQYVYFALNKPAGVYCTQNELAGRTRAVDLLRGVRQRVYPVGRLEAESMGLLLLTNDGLLTQQLTHPRFHVPKTYRVEVNGAPSRTALESLRSGVWLSEGRTAPARIDVIHSNQKRTILEITVSDFRHRELRRVLAKIGHNVRRLTRIRIGRLSIEKLPLGAFRPLTMSEVKHLKSLTKPGAIPMMTGRVSVGRPRPRRSTLSRGAPSTRKEIASTRPMKRKRRIVSRPYGEE